MSPAQPKPKLGGLDAAIKKVQRQHAVVQRHLAAGHAAAVERAALINRALELGATLRELAQDLEVSPETVRKMASVR